MIELDRNKKDVDDIKEEMKKFRQEMNARPVRQENTVPIVVGQHYGFSNFSEFRSMQMSEQSASHYWQPSSHPGSYYSFGQPPSHMVRPNLQTTIETQHDVEAIVDHNIPNRGRRQQVPSKYLVTPFTVQAPTTMVPKQRVSKTTNKGNKANLSPLNLGGVFEGYNEEENNVTFLGSQFTLFYENVDPAKVSIVMGEIFSLEARDMDMKLLSAPESNNTLARCSSLGIVVGGLLALICFLVRWPTLLQSITLDSARSYVMHSAFLTQGTVSNIPIVFSWGGSISPEGFLSSILLWLVITVAVVGVGVTVVVVVESS
ncbi:hypothetical protein Tco_1150908, partial [Tanacetum coccineum]